MSIATYAELKTALANWLKRSDLTSYLPDFIAIGEARLNRSLRLSQMEATATVTLAEAADYAPLPDGFLELLDLSYDSDGLQPARVPVTTLGAMSATAAGRPEAFAVAARFEVSRTADRDYALTARYRARWDIAGDTANWLLTNHPDAYLFTALAEAAPYLKDDKRVPVWEAKADRTIAELNRLDQRSRGRAALRVDTGLAAAPPYDIRRGY